MKWNVKLAVFLKSLDELGVNRLVKRNVFLTYVLSRAFSTLCAFSPKEDCTGVYFVMKSSFTGLRTVFSTEIGEIPDEKKDKYEKMANKKIDTLYPLVKYANSKVFSASQQCYDPDADEWGGAIVYHSTYYSASGHIQAGDESLSIIASLAMAMLSGEYKYLQALDNAAVIISNSDNKIAKRLIEAVFE